MSNKNNQKGMALVFESLVSSSVKKRMIYQLARQSSGVRVLVVNNEYYRECTSLGAPGQFFIGSNETDLLLSLVDDKQNWIKIVKALNMVEPFKTYSEHFGTFFMIPWLSGLWLIANENMDDFFRTISKLSTTKNDTSLITMFQAMLKEIPQDGLTVDQKNAINACLNEKMAKDGVKVLYALVKLYEPMAARKQKQSVEALNLTEALNQNENTLLVIPASRLSDDSLGRVSYALTRELGIAQYLDTEAIKALDSSNFWRDNAPVKGAAVLDGSVSMMSYFLYRAQNIYASVSTLQDNRSNVKAWLSVNAPELLRQIPGNYDTLLVENLPVAYQIDYYLSIFTENGDGQNAVVKLVLCSVGDSGKLQMLEADKYLQKKPDAELEETVKLKQQISNLQQSLEQLTESLQDEKAEDSTTDDPYGEYPDQFSEAYSFLDER